MGGGSITQELVTRLGKAIVRGDFGSDHRLPPEAGLSAHYQASRTVTREAIKILTGKGLIISWPKRGTLIQHESRWNLMDPDVLAWLLERPPTPTLVDDIFQMRLAIEPAATSVAARKRADTQEIEAALQSMRDAKAGIGDAMDADSAFHSAILRASGNRFFAQMAPLVGAALRMTARLSNQAKGVAAASVADHKRILDAVVKGTPEEAYRASEMLILEALDLTRAFFDES